MRRLINLVEPGKDGKMKDQITALVKCTKGQEFFYSASSAHYVSTKKAADIIAKELNKIAYTLKASEVWRPIELDKYDTAYIYAESQKFTLNVNTGAIRERKSSYY